MSANDGFLIKKSFGWTVLEAVYDSIYPNKCLFCGRVMDDLKVISCADCAELHDGNYDEQLVANVVFRFKYNGKRMLARRMAQAIFGRDDEINGDCLIPVPLHANRVKERGYNQAELLAIELSLLCGLPAYDGILRTRYTAKQFDLNPEERAANVAGAFVVKDGFCVVGRRVVLVDDVLTTGATSGECERVLLEAGAKSVELVVFATAVLGEGSAG